MNLRGKKTMLLILAAAAVSGLSAPAASAGQAGAAEESVKEVRRLNPTSAELILSDGHCMTVDFYAPDIFRLFRDDNGGRARTVLTLTESPDEYFYGGGVQNGRFSHKGRVINIVNENSWTDGGVASPAPYYWSTAGYGIMWHTFAPGAYDFGAAEKGTVCLTHDTDYLDIFVMVAGNPTAPGPCIRHSSTWATSLWSAGTACCCRCASVC